MTKEQGIQEKVKLVGVGPGDPDYVTMRVAQEVAAADVVVGFATVLAVVDHYIKGQRIVLTYRNQEEQLAEAARAHAEGKRCVVCCYGDLNFSAQELIARVERHCGATERIPGISSVQVACARSALAMEETLFFTLHARDGIHAAKQEIIDATTAGKCNLIILPLPWSFMPPQMAQMLIEGGIAGKRTVTVHQRLTLAGESSLHTTLQQLATWKDAFSDLSIMVLPHPDVERRTGEA
ncbi:MAG: precorrin-6y C5,15-methyltransferase (decarboxylating) subunit CbiE [Ktedonobacteraceae bacterium]|nr:precorrin-6y C5,15-methyltransferase (decarboxylating) subunit CbiE [Ktedonobacteraceae bacterium]